MSRTLGVLPALVLLLSFGCAEDMDQQPSFRPMEEPRLHSPDGSVPRDSRSAMTAPARSSHLAERGRELYRINCVHCHGVSGAGDGPVAGRLARLPTDLRAPHVQVKPDVALYAVVTEGMAVMPAFKGLLSVEERWAVVYHVKSWGPARQPPEEGNRR